MVARQGDNNTNAKVLLAAAWEGKQEGTCRALAGLKKKPVTRDLCRRVLTTSPVLTLYTFSTEAAQVIKKLWERGE